MRVIATQVGYDNIKVREPGEEFDMPEGSVGSWFESLDEPVVAPKPAKKTGKHKADEGDEFA